jgi:uncharacterized protein YndB with AHSA1/START domain
MPILVPAAGALTMNVYFEGTIAKPIHLVFDAIVDHRRMVHYFISRADGPMQEGRTVRWEWEDVGTALDIEVERIVPNSLIRFRWSATGVPSLVTIALEATGNDTTRVRITEEGWEAGEEKAAKVVQQSIGWTDFFCSLKAYLLFHVNLRKGKALAQHKAFL